MVVEIGFEVTEEEKDQLLTILGMTNFKAYLEPPNNYTSLEDLEAQCEGK